MMQIQGSHCLEAGNCRYGRAGAEVGTNLLRCQMLTVYEDPMRLFGGVGYDRGRAVEQIQAVKAGDPGSNANWGCRRRAMVGRSPGGGRQSNETIAWSVAANLSLALIPASFWPKSRLPKKKSQSKPWVGVGQS